MVKFRVPVLLLHEKIFRFFLRAEDIWLQRICLKGYKLSFKPPLVKYYHFPIFFPFIISPWLALPFSVFSFPYTSTFPSKYNCSWKPSFFLHTYSLTTLIWQPNQYAKFCSKGLQYCSKVYSTWKWKSDWQNHPTLDHKKGHVTDSLKKLFH